jgi:hypothetical protein
MIGGIATEAATLSVDFPGAGIKNLDEIYVDHPHQIIRQRLEDVLTQEETCDE